MRPICMFDGCGRTIDARNRCARHYRQWKVEGGLGVVCEVVGCVEFALTRQRCSTHYEQLRRSGACGNSPCLFEGCGRAAMTRGMCQTHYVQALAGKSLTAVIKGEWSDWSVHVKGYVTRRRTVDGKRETQFQHRLVMEEHLGRELLRHEEVHHKNGNRADNRLDNLEVWNTSQPKGQRPEDKVEYALEILALYAPHMIQV